AACRVARSPRVSRPEPATRDRGRADRPRAVRLRRARVWRRWHARSWQPSYHYDRTAWTVSMESPSYLPGVLALPAPTRTVDQQCLAAGDAGSRASTDVIRGDPARGAIPGNPLPVGLPGV